MSLNPFVALAEDPVVFFAWLGYGLFLLSLSIMSTAYVWRTLVWLRVRWGNRHTNWRSEYVPPTGFVLRLASVPLTLMVTAWAVGGLVFLLSP